MASNGLSDVVEVVQTAVEDLDIEEGSVDIIISEWMGYFLLRESMLDSLLRARDKFLKPGGLMFPSHATMYVVCLSRPRRVCPHHDHHRARVPLMTHIG